MSIGNLTSTPSSDEGNKFTFKGIIKYLKYKKNFY